MLATAIAGRRAHVASCAALLVVVAAVMAPLLPTGFHGDDPGHLHAVALHPPLEFLVSAAATADLGGNFFTPLLGTSIAVDWRLFGLDPLGYGVHSAVALWLLGIAVVLLLRTLGAGVTAATLGAAAVVANPATVSVAAWFSTRHYLEGAVWAVLASACAVHAVRRRRPALVAAAAVLCLLALLSKEIFVPLPALCVLLLGPLPRRWRWLLGGAGAVVLVGYALLRLALTGGAAAGYHSLAQLSAAGAVRGLVSSVPALLGAVFWPGGTAPPAAAIMAGGVLLTACAIAAWRRARGHGILGLAAVLAAALAPASLVLLFQGGAAISGELTGSRLAFPLALALVVTAAVLACSVTADHPAAARPRAAALLLLLVAATLPGCVATVAAWRSARAESGAAFEFVRARWRRSELVVSMVGVGVFRAGTRLLLGVICPGPHLMLIGGHPVPAREVRALDPAAFYTLPDDLVGRPERTAAEVERLIAGRHTVLADAPEAPLRFSVVLRWTGEAYEWRLSPPTYRYLHLWEPVATAAATDAESPCGGTPAAPAPERAVGEYISLPPTGSVSRAALERQGIAALRARIRALDGNGGYRDSPDFLVDLSMPEAYSWSADEEVAAPAAPRDGNG